MLDPPMEYLAEMLDHISHAVGWKWDRTGMRYINLVIADA
jgi:hypothetical protein